jgi:hypothetical protein
LTWVRILLPTSSVKSRNISKAVDMFLCQIKIKWGMFVLSYKSFEFSQLNHLFLWLCTCCSVRHGVLSVQLPQVLSPETYPRHGVRVIVFSATFKPRYGFHNQFLIFALVVLAQ